MKTHLSFILLFSLFLFASCQPTDPTMGTTVVKGQVVQYLTQKGVPNATVQVFHATTAGGYAPVGTPYPADQQGHFSFNFEADNKSGYLLKAAAPPGYVTDWALAPTLTAGRQNENLLVPTYAPAWVRLELVDEYPKSRVVIQSNGYEGSGDTFYYPRDTVVIRPLLAGFRSGILWVINDQGKMVTNNLFVQPKALDTLTIRIPF